MANLSVANLMHRKTRTLVVVLAVAVEVATVMLLVGLADGTLNAIARRLESVGADALLQPPDSSLILGVTSAVLPVRLTQRAASVPGVTSVAPVLNWQVTRIGERATSLNLWAVDPAGFERLAGGLDLVAGRPLRDPGDLVVSSREAGALVKALQAGLPGYKVTAVAQVSRAIQRNAVGLRESQGALTSLAVVISFLVVLLAMYTAILERTREIGILRALGATRPRVVALIVSEGTLLCALGGVAGVCLAFVGRVLLRRFFPAQDVDFTLGWTLGATALGLVGGLVGSFYPAVRAARLDPIVALAAE